MIISQRLVFLIILIILFGATCSYCLSAKEAHNGVRNGLFLSNDSCLLTEWNGSKLVLPILTYPNARLIDLNRSITDKKAYLQVDMIISNGNINNIFDHYKKYYKQFIKKGWRYSEHKSKYEEAFELYRQAHQYVIPLTVVVSPTSSWGNTKRYKGLDIGFSVLLKK